MDEGLNTEPLMKHGIPIPEHFEFRHQRNDEIHQDDIIEHGDITSICITIPQNGQKNPLSHVGYFQMNPWQL